MVKTLLAQGYAVRAGVRDRAKAENVLPSDPFLDIVVADVTQPLPADLLQGSRAVINCVGAKVQPNPNAPPPALKLSVRVQRRLNLRACGICWNVPNPIFKVNPTPIPSLTIAIPRPPEGSLGCPR